MGGAVTEITFWPIVWNDTFNPYQPNFPHQYVGWMHSSAAGQCICSFNLKPRPVEYKMSWIYLSLCKPSPTVRLFYAVIWKMTHHHLFPLLQTAEWKVILYSKGTKGWCKDVIINIEYSDWNKLAQIWIPFFFSSHFLRAYSPAVVKSLDLAFLCGGCMFAQVFSLLEVWLCCFMCSEDERI